MSAVIAHLKSTSLISMALFVAASMGLTREAHAMADTTWLNSPANTNFNGSTNYQSPNSEGNVATAPTTDGDGVVYGNSTITNPTLTANATTSAITVNAVAPAYTLNNPGYNWSITGTEAASIGQPGFLSTPNPNSSAIANNSANPLAMTVSAGGTTTFGNPVFNAFAGALPITLSSNVQLSTGAGGGSYVFAANSSAGTSTIAVNPGGRLVFTSGMNGATATRQNGSGGMAAVTSSSGTVDVSSLANAAGVTGGQTTTLGSLAGSGTVALGANNLTLGSTNTSTIYSGAFTGTGAFTKVGSGMFVADGNSTATGLTTISGGTLEVGDANNAGATIGGSVAVQSGTILMGHGTIEGNATVTGGMVRPGGTIGTLAVNGNYTQDANSTLRIELNRTTSSLLKVGGLAQLAGTLSVVTDYGMGTYTAGKQYMVLTAANGVHGAFGTVSSPSVEAGNGTKLDFQTTYLPTAVDLTLVPVPGLVTNPPPPVRMVMFNEGTFLTPNEANVTNAIESILTPASAGAFAQGLVALGTAPGQAGLRTQLAGVLGEARADLATVDLANLTSFQNFLVERMDRRQGLTSTMEVNTGLPGTFDVAQNGSSDMPLFGPSGLVDVDAPSLWVHGYGVLGETGGQAGFADFQYQTGGLVAGIDGKVSDTTLLGVAAAYEHTDLNLSGDSSSNQIDTYRVSVYGSQKLDPVGVPLTLDAAAGYAFNDYHDNDFLQTGTGFSQTSRHDGNELTAEAGLSQDVHIAQDLVTGALTVVPRVGIEYDNIQQNPYSTTGASATGANFATNGSTLNALRSTIGARADLKLTAHDGTVITPEVRASYLHDFMDTNVPLTESFTGAPAAGFRITGVHPGREAALVGTGLSAGFSDNLSATIGYDAAVRDRELDHTVQVGVKYTW